jgi:glycosyltransferase involved in cell wall biosynthesis
VKIAIITEEFLPYPGGIAMYVSKLADECMTRNYDTDVIVIGNRQLFTDALHSKYQIIHCYKKAFSLKHYFLVRNSIKRVLKLKSYDLVICADYRSMLAAAYLNTIDKKAIIHGSEIQSRLLRLLSNLGIRPLCRFSKVIANSKNTKDLALKHHPYLAENNLVKVSYLGANKPDRKVTPKNIDFSDGKVSLLSVGRIEERKGLHITLQALIQLNTKFSVEFNIVGKVIDKEYYQVLLNLAQNLPARVKVNFKGAISQNELELIYRDCDIFIHSSVPMDLSSEGFGLVILEASSRNIPVVVADTDALTEVVSHGETGILVPNSCPKKLAEAISLFIKDPPFTSLPNEASEAFLERFTWSSHLDGVLYD